jgi:hypothetical protein
MLSLALSAYEHIKKEHTTAIVCSHSIFSEKIDKNQTVISISRKEEIMNSKRILLIAFNTFVLGMVISMISTGTNWDSTAAHVLSAFSLGLNIIFLEYIGLKGE